MGNGQPSPAEEDQSPAEIHANLGPHASGSSRRLSHRHLNRNDGASDDGDHEYAGVLGKSWAVHTHDVAADETTGHYERKDDRRIQSNTVKDYLAASGFIAGAEPLRKGGDGGAGENAGEKEKSVKPLIGGVGDAHFSIAIGLID